MNQLKQSITSNSNRQAQLNKALKATANLWFIIAVIGQWLFAIYVAAFYGGAAMQGDFMKWNRVLPHGYAEGETMDNLATAIHVFLAVAILVGGPLQFIPAIRNRFRKFHRINGRLYVSLMILVGLSGVYMVLSKGTVSGLIGDISININAVLILIFSILTIQRALSKKFEAHNQWAFRLFLVANGVWFFRIGLMFWLMVMGGPVGFDPETFRGPFLIFLGFGQYLIPLAIYQLYLKSKKSNAFGKFSMSIILIGCFFITAIGIFAATMGMWLPRL
ncbi:DUF2306 domain-containing protein [Croceitalea rosinachiae]|uniref:DUF2306 domain-containing protein n=1 Tax=Croceitalea rosinachiae TaxID=3075596 RepID=A0ABU3A5R2_9FLAO|nr:DUF2306 domain-containing protein [Croceitalea sp. F388]MDT0605512.1 DUF2306 domain-containing protein [Croceitalea sp. F388]